MRQGMSSKDAYTKGVFDVMKASSEKRGNATGWKKYTQSGDIKDAESLNADLAGTNWCTGGSVGTASLHLSGGDFYVYFKMVILKLPLEQTTAKLKKFAAAERDRTLHLQSLIMLQKHLFAQMKGHKVVMIICTIKTSEKHLLSLQKQENFQRKRINGLIKMQSFKLLLQSIHILANLRMNI